MLIFHIEELLGTDWLVGDKVFRCRHVFDVSGHFVSLLVLGVKNTAVVPAVCILIAS